MTTAIANRSTSLKPVTAKLTRKDCKSLLDRSFPHYKGRKFSVEVTDRFTLSDTNWGGGSRNYYAFIREDGAVAPLFSGVAPAPWVIPWKGKSFAIPDNVIVAEHCIFCGKDMGVRFYISSGCKTLPPAVVKMLPARCWRWLRTNRNEKRG